MNAFRRALSFAIAALAAIVTFNAEAQTSGGSLQRSKNLSDLLNPAAARINLGVDSALPGVSLLDYGGDTAKTGAQNAAAFNAILAAYPNGVRILVPRGTYALAGSSVNLNIAGTQIQGETPVSTYDTVGATNGTVFTVTSGDWAFVQSARQTRISNVTIDGSGGTTEYGIVTTVGNTIQDGVTVRNFPYCYAGSALNANIFWNITALLCSKIGLVVLPANVSGVGAYAYPKIDSLIGSTTSTIFTIGGQSKFESNKIGIALLAGYGAHIFDTIVESNTNYGLLIYKRNGTTNNFRLDNVWFEDNGTQALPWTISLVEAFKTSTGPTTYLKNSAGAQWTAGTDDGYTIWMGAEDEDYTSGNNQFGGPAYVTIRGGVIEPHAGNSVARLRSSRYLWLDRVGFQSPGTTDFSATANAFKTKISNPSSVAINAQIAGMQPIGTNVIYEFDNSPLYAVNTSIATATWSSLVDVSTMARGLKYQYSASITNQWGTYGQQGYVFHDGTSVQLVKQYTSPGSDVRINGTTLQYQQVSGVSATFSWKIYPAGPIEQLSQ